MPVRLRAERPLRRPRRHSAIGHVKLRSRGAAIPSGMSGCADLVFADVCAEMNVARIRHISIVHPIVSTKSMVQPCPGGQIGGTIVDGYTFIAEIVKAVTSMIAAFALPTALVISVWLFKEKLATLLLLLRVRHRDWEASFRWDKAEAEAKRLPKTPYDLETQPTPEEKSRFEQMARISPREAILEVGTQLEEAVRSYASATGFANYSRRYALLIRLLRTNRLIDSNTSALLDDLQNIGNAAAHNLSDPTEIDAVRYKKLADQLIRHFDSLAATAETTSIVSRARIP